MGNQNGLGYLYSEPIAKDIYRYKITREEGSRVYFDIWGLEVFCEPNESDQLIGPGLAVLHRETPEWLARYTESLGWRVANQTLNVWVVGEPLRVGKQLSTFRVCCADGLLYQTKVPTVPLPVQGDRLTVQRTKLEILNTQGDPDLVRFVVRCQGEAHDAGNTVS